MRPTFQHYANRGSIRPVRIVRLELSNVGPFIDAFVDLPPQKGKGELVLLEGPNGSGKTSMLYAIACLAGGNAVFLQPPSISLHQRTDTTHGGDMTLFVEHEGDAAPTCVRYAPHPSMKPMDPMMSVHHAAGAKSTGILRDFAQGAMPSTWAVFLYQAHGPDAALSAKGTAPEVYAVKHPYHFALSPEGKGHCGQHLGHLLLSLRRKYISLMGYAATKPEEAEHYTARAAAKLRALERIEAGLTDVLGRKVTFRFVGEDESVIVSIDGRAIDASVLGEGLRGTLSWLSDLLFRLEQTQWSDETRSPWEQDFWLLLDEIEESLHPIRQMQIIPAIRRLFPCARIYATTHSPFVVASAGEGIVLPIRPGKDYKVRGEIVPRELKHGQSLEWVIREIFQAQAGFQDQQTRDDLDAHDRDIRRLQRRKGIDWNEFMVRRNRLMDSNDEVRTVVAMQEVPARDEITPRLLEQADSQGGDT